MSVVRVVLALFLALAGLALAPSPAWAAGNVTVTVSGHGSVTGEGIDCGPDSSRDCSHFYADVPTQEECDPDPKIPCVTIYEDPVVELTANEGENGYAFGGWTVCPSANGRVCTMTVSSDLGVSAVFHDVTAPTVTAPHPGGGAVRGTITLASLAHDNSGAVDRVEFRVRGHVVGVDRSAPYSVTFDTTSVQDGSAALQATAYDAGGRSSSDGSTVTIDNTEPDTSVVSGPEDGSFTKSRDVTFQVSSEPQAALECRLYLAGGEAPDTESCADGSFAATALSDGTYVFEARATDTVGNVDATPAQRTFTVDNVAPDTEITKGPKPVVKTSKKRVRAVFEFGAAESAQLFECKLDSKPWTECSSPASYRVPKGKHTFKVRATDLAGNRDSTPATWRWTVRRR